MCNKTHDKDKVYCAKSLIHEAFATVLAQWVKQSASPDTAWENLVPSISPGAKGVHYNVFNTKVSDISPEKKGK